MWIALEHLKRAAHEAPIPVSRRGVEKTCSSRPPIEAPFLRGLSNLASKTPMPWASEIRGPGIGGLLKKSTKTEA
jgi:hypothetical protein